MRQWLSISFRLGGDPGIAWGESKLNLAKYRNLEHADLLLNKQPCTTGVVPDFDGVV